MQSVDLRQSKRMYAFVLLGSLLFCSGLFIAKPSSFYDYVMMAVIVGLFGLGGIGLGLYGLVISRGRSGMQFFTDRVKVEFANGNFVEYPYSSLQSIAIQEIALPQYAKMLIAVSEAGTLITSPVSSITNPEMFESGNWALAIKLAVDTQIPRTGRMDTYLFSNDKLKDWSDVNKLDIYQFFTQVSPKKRKQVYEFLTQQAQQVVIVLPTLELRTT